jgi:hypothetical protein
VLLFLVRRERVKMKNLERETMSLSGVPFEKIEKTTPEDDEAYRIIEEERKKIWKNFSSDTEFAVEYVFSLSKEITKKVASVYFPESEEPMYQATVEGLLHLVKRVAERMEGYLNRFPLAFLKDRNVKDMLLVHDWYKKVTESKFAKILGNKFVYMGRRLAWAAYNVTNPWYFGRKIMWAVGKEAGRRYFLTLIVTIVGEEAVLLYRRGKKS